MANSRFLVVGVSGKQIAVKTILDTGISGDTVTDGILQMKCKDLVVSPRCKTFVGSSYTGEQLRQLMEAAKIEDEPALAI